MASTGSPDVAASVDLLVRALATGEEIHHAHFGDGDFFFMYNRITEMTCEDEHNTPQLSSWLKDAWRVVTEARGCYLGDLLTDPYPHVLREAGPLWEDALRGVLLRRGCLPPLVHIEAPRARLLHAAKLYVAIRDDPREVLFVGPERMYPAARMLDADFWAVPLGKAWVVAHEAVETARKYGIVVLAAGRGSKLIQAACVDSGASTIDIGSGLDLVFVGPTRWHDEQPASPTQRAVRAHFRAAGLEV